MTDPTPIVRRAVSREESLRRAQAKRTQIAKVKAAIKDRVLDDLALLRGDLTDYEPLIADWPLDRMLKACHRIGPQRAMDILVTARLSPHLKIGQLSYERREHLARLVIESRRVVGS
jgi:hypothetical protein